MPSTTRPRFPVVRLPLYLPSCEGLGQIEAEGASGDQVRLHRFMGGCSFRAGFLDGRELSPMSLDQATVARIARLARIHIPEGEQAELAVELSRILGWIEQLGEVDTDDVEPLRSVM
ncbi:MAG: aspartyl/glutamyl-tRNA amidotransferase subunit C, partial [Geminicoccaceae bacterium]|nr:aspartyl/glutamyl-tRNA amidotransferase subunit C [Geminicoccaceae bacterium]